MPDVSFIHMPQEWALFKSCQNCQRSAGQPQALENMQALDQC